MLLESTSHLLTSGISQWQRLNKNGLFDGAAALMKSLEGMSTAMAASDIIRKSAGSQKTWIKDNLGEYCHYNRLEGDLGSKMWYSCGKQ